MRHETHIRIVLCGLSALLGSAFIAPGTSPPALSQQVNEVQQKHSAAALIEQAYAKKQINLDQWALYQCYALFDQQKLPDQYRSPVREECATWIVDGIYRNWQRFSQATKEILMTYRFQPNGVLARPIGLDSTRSTPHFKIHYSVQPEDTNAVPATDADGNGTPDFIDTVMVSLEYVWTFEVGDSMKYVAPPSDFSKGGDSKYDFYIHKLTKAGGLAPSDSLIKDNPNSPETEYNAYTSYVELDNYRAWILTGGLFATIAHEFYHAVQWGYDGNARPWMKEATSAWCEDEVYDDVNANWRHLPDWFASPWIPLDDNPYPTPETFRYGSWIFFRYLSEHVGGRATVRRIWEKSRIPHAWGEDISFKAIGEALAERFTNFENVFRNFTVANYLKTVPPFDYSEGAYYPGIIPYITHENLSHEDTLRRRASRYYEIQPVKTFSMDEALSITFTSLDPATKFGVQLLTKTAGQYTRSFFSQSITLTNIPARDDIVVIVMNFDTTGTSNVFRLDIKETGVTLSKEAPLFANPGETVTYKINFGNGGADTLTNVVIRDYLPKNLQFISASTGGGLVGNVVQWNIGTLEPGDTGRFVTFRGKVHALCGVLENVSYTLAADNIPTVVGPYAGTMISGEPIETIITDIGIGPSSSDYPGGINDSTQVIFPQLGEIWKDCNRTRLRGLPPDFPGAMPQDINKWGEIVGTMENSRTGRIIGFIQKDDTPRELIPSLRDQNYRAWGINDKGQVVGDVIGAVPWDWLYGFLWDDVTMTMTVLTHPDTSKRVLPMRINNNSEIVGSIQAPGIGPQAFSWKSGGFTLLPSFPRGRWNPQAYGSLATGINDLGQIIGTAVDTLIHGTDTTAVTRPAFWPSASSAPINLTPDQWYGYLYTGDAARDINNRSEVVGSYLNGSRAYIWTPQGGFKDLNDILPPGTGWVLNIASAINNKGQIAGQGTLHGEPYRAFILTRVEQPISVDTYPVAQLPKHFSLSQNYPNPFNPATTIRFNVPAPSHVTIKIYDGLGREVKTLLDRKFEAGSHVTTWDGNNNLELPVATGVYFVRMRAGEFVGVKKLLLVR